MTDTPPGFLSGALKAEQAIEAMRSGAVVRRIGPDGRPAKFMRMRGDEVESADTERRLAANDWHASRIDIASFVASTFARVRRVRPLGVEVRCHSAVLEFAEAHRRLAEGATVAVIPSADAAERGPVFLRMTGGVLHQVDGDEALAANRWRRASMPAADLLSARFRRVDSYGAKDVEIEYET